MYLSDYIYAYQSGGEKDCKTTGCRSWLYDSSNTTYTMNRYGMHSDNTYYIWATRDLYGDITWAALTYNCAIRPVFYLNSEEIYVSGAGTISNPIVISGIN